MIRTARLALAPLVTLLALLGGAGSAHAEGYRYWSFWERDGSQWVYAQQGPGTARPGDGDVVGFRFAVSEDSADATRPRGTADFAAICADGKAEDGRKRVAFVLDFGTPEDSADGATPPAQRTECAVVPEDATAADALAAVAEPLRFGSNGLLCAIAGYPAKGCGETVSSADEKSGSGTPAADEDSGEGPSAGLIGGVAAVAVLGAAAVWQARRRRA
ncbi:SCO2322 family protein [Streptomyces sp. NPDC051940]|uniref:SCO2322 family protein n=1 Tax=Streptomyces sp. NPDC051940 TaxID=3155675 RepID=UPI00343AAE37